MPVMNPFLVDVLSHLNVFPRHGDEVAVIGEFEASKGSFAISSGLRTRVLKQSLDSLSVGPFLRSLPLGQYKAVRRSCRQFRVYRLRVHQVSAASGGVRLKGPNSVKEQCSCPQRLARWLPVSIKARSQRDRILAWGSVSRYEISALNIVSWSTAADAASCRVAPVAVLRPTRGKV